MKAYLHQTRISPKKVNLVAKLVRGKSIAVALTILQFLPKRSAPVLAKLIKSAVANAENNFKQDPTNLVISKLVVNGGTTLKRGRPISRGRWHPVLKRTSHVTVEVSPGTTTEKANQTAVSKKTVTRKAEPKNIETAKSAKPAEVKVAEKKTESKIETEKPKQSESKKAGAPKPEKTESKKEEPDVIKGAPKHTGDKEDPSTGSGQA